MSHAGAGPTSSLVDGGGSGGGDAAGERPADRGQGDTGEEPGERFDETGDL